MKHIVVLEVWVCVLTDYTVGTHDHHYMMDRMTTCDFCKNRNACTPQWFNANRT